MNFVPVIRLLIITLTSRTITSASLRHVKKKRKKEKKNVIIAHYDENNIRSVYTSSC